ncbi:MAG: hypothetical protein HY257_08215, partial [Chloroflexi bacterium]|nr:hypothetical protein [Chloroflexota bacterium]
GRVEYSDRADSIFAAELAAKRELIAERIELNGENVLVTHTKFDIGSLKQIFDDDIYSVARGVETNPLVLQIQFPTPRSVSALSGIFGRARFQVTAQVCGASEDCATYTSVFNFADAVPGQFSGPRAEMKFDRAPARVSMLRVEILYLDAGADAHVHVFEMKIQ